MPEPFVLVQLSDPHIGATWGGGGAAELLGETVEWVRTHGPKADAVLVSGDLSDHAADDEYEVVRELLEPLAVPICVLPGNHDDAVAMRRHFEVPDAADDPFRVAFELGPLRLVVVDSNRPGEEAGELDGETLSWLEATLAAEPDRPTLLALHHPPLLTGIAAWDEMLLAPSDRLALGAIVAASPQLRVIAAGHLHRPLVGTLGGCPVLAAPSTYVQAELDAGLKVSLTNERPGYVLHMLVDGELVSSIHTIP